MYSTRVYYQDTDAGGIVYFANYLKFIEKSWFEYLMSIGISIPEWQSRGTFIIVKSVVLNLMEPVRYGDTITVETCVTEVKNAYFILFHTVIRADRKTTECETKMVCVDESGKPRRMPEEFRARLLQTTKTGNR